MTVGVQTAGALHRLPENKAKGKEGQWPPEVRAEMRAGESGVLRPRAAGGGGESPRGALGPGRCC